jgi:hypothetical protein
MSETSTPHSRNKICEQNLSRPHESKGRLGRTMPTPENNIKSDPLQKIIVMMWTILVSLNIGSSGGIF